VANRLNALWGLLWEERRAVHFVREVLDPLPAPRPGALSVVLGPVIDLSTAARLAAGGRRFL